MKKERKTIWSQKVAVMKMKKVGRELAARRETSMRRKRVRRRRSLLLARITKL